MLLCPGEHHTALEEATFLIQTNQQNPRVLVVDDDDAARRFVARSLARKGFSTQSANGGRQAVLLLKESQFDAIVCDLLMPEVDGLDVLKHCSTLKPIPTFIMLTAHGNVAVAVNAMKLGAVDFLEKPAHVDEIEAALVSALAKPESNNSHAIRDHKRRDTRRTSLVGSESWLIAFSELLQKIASTDAIVLIEGETGTGKSAVAKEIWRLSNRSRGPFLAINCAAINKDLIENELFGNIKGAFTGATGKMGIVEKANQGSLFLDEIGELPLELQAKLLQLLQERTFTPVGATAARQADVRFIAATNRKLEQEARAGSFRPDLYYRLEVVKLTIPPLRERIEDVPILLEHFRREAAEKHGRAPTFPPSTVAALSRYSWPGNVRELENLVYRLSVMLENGQEASPEHLPERIRRDMGSLKNAGSQSSVSVPPIASAETIDQNSNMNPPAMDDVVQKGLAKAMKTYEAQIIYQALQQTSDNVTQAAKLLSMKRTTLIEKRRRYEELGLL